MRRVVAPLIGAAAAVTTLAVWGATAPDETPVPLLPHEVAAGCDRPGPWVVAHPPATVLVTVQGDRLRLSWDTAVQMVTEGTDLRVVGACPPAPEDLA